LLALLARGVGVMFLADDILSCEGTISDLGTVFWTNQALFMNTWYVFASE